MTMNKDGVSDEALAEMLANWRETYSLSAQEARMFDQIDASLRVRAPAVVTEEMVELAQEAWADAYDAEYFSDGSTKDNKAACMRAALEAALSVRAEPVAVKPLEWRYVWHGSEPNRGSNIYLTDASGLGRGELLCNLGADRHWEARALVDLHNDAIRSALVASPAAPAPQQAGGGE